MRRRAGIRADDCDSDGITDLCEIYNGAGDCNTNNIPDTCDVDDGTSEDWNWDYIPDECQDFSGGSTLNDPDSWDSYLPGYWGLGGQGYNCSGFSGIIYDGWYIYYVPGQGATGPHTQMLRYDTRGGGGGFGDFDNWDSVRLPDHRIGQQPARIPGWHLSTDATST